MCDFCNMYIDTTPIYFRECIYIYNNFGTMFQTFYEVHYEININFEVISLGIHEYTVNMNEREEFMKEANVHKFILLLETHFMFKSKYSEDIATF